MGLINFLFVCLLVLVFGFFGVLVPFVFWGGGGGRFEFRREKKKILIK